MSTSSENCAQILLDVTPIVMRFIRTEMRRHRSADLSIPQFRTLTYIHRNSGASLLDVANHLGFTPPSTSSLVDELVKRNLVLRQPSTTDRRRITLMLTSEGESLLKMARQETQTRLVDILRKLPPADLELVTQAMHILQPVFSEGVVSFNVKELTDANLGS